ncbi:MAG: KEOPS complex subunit Pcc1 [Candidatus Methanoperedens sp.]
MKVRGKLVFTSGDAPGLVRLIAESLSPDNVSGIDTVVEGDSVTVTFEGEKIGSVLSSVDDYLMNARIAEDVLELGK